MKHESPITAVDVCKSNKTLRDEFAMAALNGCLSYSYLNPSTGNYHENSNPENVAKVCYLYADAMLKVRSL